MGVNFNTEERRNQILMHILHQIFQVHSQNWPVVNLPIVDLTEYVIFGFSFHVLAFFPLLAKFECHYLLAIEFFSVLAAIM